MTFYSILSFEGQIDVFLGIQTQRQNYLRDIVLNAFAHYSEIILKCSCCSSYQNDVSLHE